MATECLALCRRRSHCKDCGGSSICEHGRRKYRCKDCGGSSFCEHGKRKSRCKDCSVPRMPVSISNGNGQHTQMAKHALSGLAPLGSIYNSCCQASVAVEQRGRLGRNDKQSPVARLKFGPEQQTAAHTYRRCKHNQPLAMEVIIKEDCRNKHPAQED